MEVRMLFLVSFWIAVAHVAIAQLDAPLLGEPATVPPSPSPSISPSPSPSPLELFPMTEESFTITRRRLTTVLSQFHLLHIPGDEVYGTVLLFCNLLESPSRLNETAAYLYKSGFNVVVLPLAGLPENVLPSTKLRVSSVRTALVDTIKGTEAARGRVVQIHSTRSSNERMAVAMSIQEEVMPLLQERLEEQEKYSPELVEEALTVLNCLDPAGDKMEEMARQQALHRYFESDHERYAAVALLQMATVVSLPGPIFSIGVGYGAVASLAVARTGAVSRVVLLAPRLGLERKKLRKDNAHFADIVSTIGGGMIPYNEREVPAHQWVSVNLAARRELSNRNAQDARTAEVLAIFAKDDSAVDAQILSEFVQGRLGGTVVQYDAEHGIGKRITVEDENPLAGTMMFGLAKFLVGIPFDEANFKPKMKSA